MLQRKFPVLCNLFSFEIERAVGEVYGHLTLMLL